MDAEELIEKLEFLSDKTEDCRMELSSDELLWLTSTYPNIRFTNPITTYAAKMVVDRYYHDNMIGRYAILVDGKQCFTKTYPDSEAGQLAIRNEVERLIAREPNRRVFVVRVEGVLIPTTIHKTMVSGDLFGYKINYELERENK